MRYCARCLIPDSKPHASFDDEGVCSACRAHELKNDIESGIDWAAREREFDELVEQTKGRRARYYDVLVPVSGGKDSITQVSRLLGHGLRILAVNVDYGIKTEIGQHNLSCIPSMGANLITYRPEEELHTRLIRIGLEDYGDPDLLSHTLLHAYPLHVALRFEIPLVMLGENSAAEYGGAADIAAETRMSRAWFTRFAANAGNDARHVSERYDIPMEQLWMYDYPDELEGSDTTATFMSHFFHWDSETHLKIAGEHGFRTLGEPGEGTYRNYVGIDELINRVHQYLKVLKFGYGRATDHACEDIRNGRLTRDEAKQLALAHDAVPLGARFSQPVADWLGYKPHEFAGILEGFRNDELWTQQPDGSWGVVGQLAGFPTREEA